MATRTSRQRTAAVESPTRLLSLQVTGWQGTASIVEDTLRAVQVIWFAAALEYAPLFVVVDRLVELFRAGALPVRAGGAGALLHEYWNERGERLSAAQRDRLYARTFGIGGALAGGVVPNRRLPELWLALIATVHDHARWSRRVQLIDRPLVRAAARELAANLARYGAGAARPAAALHEQIQQALAVLADPDVRRAYGARDVWQLVDRVAALELGGARNAGRYRTLANAGSTIIGWLVRHTGALNGAAGSSGTPRPFPSDAEFLSAVEAWLGASGTDDEDD
ncbi:MAG: hypothetical protein K2Y35_21535 [Burkholderiales bacterium]|nr:hypothetical protein [Burkholderiales bacterium]